MWILMRAVVVRWLLARVVARGVLSTLLLIPAAALLKLIGVPLFGVLAVIAVPLFMLLGSVGLPFLVALLAGAGVLLLVLAVITIGGLLLQFALIVAAAVWIGRRAWRWLSRDTTDSGEHPATGSSPAP